MKSIGSWSDSFTTCEVEDEFWAFLRWHLIESNCLKRYSQIYEKNNFIFGKSAAARVVKIFQNARKEILAENFLGRASRSMLLKDENPTEIHSF